MEEDKIIIAIVYFKQSLEELKRVMVIKNSPFPDIKHLIKEVNIPKPLNYHKPKRKAWQSPYKFHK